MPLSFSQMLKFCTANTQKHQFFHQNQRFTDHVLENIQVWKQYNGHNNILAREHKFKSIFHTEIGLTFFSIFHEYCSYCIQKLLNWQNTRGNRKTFQLLETQRPYLRLNCCYFLNPCIIQVYTNQNTAIKKKGVLIKWERDNQLGKYWAEHKSQPLATMINYASVTCTTLMVK